MDLTLLELQIEPDLSGATLYAPFSGYGTTESSGSGHGTAAPADGTDPLPVVAVAAAIAVAVALWWLARRDDGA